MVNTAVDIEKMDFVEFFSNINRGYTKPSSIGHLDSMMFSPGPSEQLNIVLVKGLGSRFSIPGVRSQL